jgi:hypothetical protein
LKTLKGGKAMQEKDIVKTLDSYFSNKLKKINLYQIPQFIWLIELYYLMSNAFIKILDNINIMHKIGLNSVVTYLPNIVVKYNELVLQYLFEWSNFILFISLALLFSGLIITLLRETASFQNFGIIWEHCSYGLDVYFWFLFIALTYYTFNTLEAWFPTFIVVLFIGSKIWSFLRQRLEDKGILYPKY